MHPSPQWPGLLVYLLFALPLFIASLAAWRAANRATHRIIALNLEINSRMDELLATTRALARAEGVAWERDRQESLHPPAESP